MLTGAFASMDHLHSFEDLGKDTTRMHDEFLYRAPLGPLGRIAEVTFLTGYLRRFLEKRAAGIRELAEGDGWRRFLKH